MVTKLVSQSVNDFAIQQNEVKRLANQVQSLMKFSKQQGFDKRLFEK